MKVKSPPNEPNSVLRQIHSESLIECEVNMTQLSQYMNSIVKVVNQHAKILDQCGYELDRKVGKKDVGEMFNILSHSFPYEQVVVK
jgi:hypothetical protein